MGQFANSSAQATNYGIQANEARLQGMLQKKQAYANAYKLEGDSRMQGEVVGENMMRASANAVARLAAGNHVAMNPLRITAVPFAPTPASATAM